MIISKRGSFDAAHFLPGYHGKCANTHGHSWLIEISVIGEENPKTRMVIDFKELALLVQNIVDRFDHTLINDTIPYPTAECIATHIKNDLQLWCIHKGVDAYSVKVWETPDSCVEIKF